MRKNWLCILTLAVVFLFAYEAHSCTLYSEPVTNFGDWSKHVNYGEVQFLPYGSSLIVETDGGASGEFEHFFPSAIGLMATVKVENTIGDNRTGIKKVVGLLEGNQVIAELALDKYSGTHTIRYRIWVEDAKLGTLSLMAVGYFGNYDHQWKLGQNVTIAMARVENEIWFYVEGYGTIVKYCPLYAIDFIESECQLFAWTSTSHSFNSITAMIYNVSVIYCREGY